MIYSEHNEQLIIEEFFQGRLGKFLDIGAFDGVNFSNTLRLLELGWTGILVEPAPTTFINLEKNLKNKEILSSQYQLINSAIVPNYFKKSTVFFEALDTRGYGSAVSSFSKDHIGHFYKMANIIEINPTRVKIEHASDFFNQVGYDFNFITIDVEGLSYELLLSVDWKKFTSLELLCIEVEVDPSPEKYIEVMSHHNFILHTVESGNHFFKKHEQN
jgi:FkbM family methyltransferase